MPGLFDTAEEAALMRAKATMEMKKGNGGKMAVPPKQNRPHKLRTVKHVAPEKPLSELVQPEPMAVVAVTAMPIPCMVLNAPMVAVSPLPMQPLRYLLPL